MVKTSSSFLSGHLDAPALSVGKSAYAENRVESDMSGIPNATAVERALAILDCLDSSKRGLNISELSRSLGIPKSSTHVIVITLERLGYLERKPASLNYNLGLKAYGLGRGMMKNLSVAEIALPNLRVLVEIGR